MTVSACGMLMVDCNFTLLIFYLLMTNFFWHDVKKSRCLHPDIRIISYICGLLCFRTSNHIDMKKRIVLIISVLLLLTPLAMHAKGALQAEFREGVDLLAAVWRLAGAKEYNRCAVTPYAESLDTFLARHKAHHAVVLARKYYGSGTGYDAVAEFGSMITINDGHITIDTARTGGLDHRWTETMRKEFIPALDDFYRQTDFHSG